MKSNLIFFLGTKAQFIKSIPVINKADAEKFNIYLYDTCQHKNITEKEIKRIKQKIHRVELSKNKFAANSISQIIFWFIKTFVSLFKNKFKFEDKENSICIVHGNTLSTILGIVWSKYNKIKILHIEGGYRSGNWFKPFPEEFIRYWSSKFSNYIVCFDDISKQNLLDMGVKGKIVQASRNTIFDTIKIGETPRSKDNKLTISIHRNENVFNKKRLKDTVDFLIYIKNNYFETANWYLHSQTKKMLEKSGLLISLKEAKISTFDLITHDEFINEIQSSSCIFTDGESVLEECKIIGTPAYALINKLENENSKGKNIFISKYNHYENLYFFKNLDSYSHKENISLKKSPSLEINYYIKTEIFKNNI